MDRDLPAGDQPRHGEAFGDDHRPADLQEQTDAARQGGGNGEGRLYGPMLAEISLRRSAWVENRCADIAPASDKYYPALRPASRSGPVASDYPPNASRTVFASSDARTGLSRQADSPATAMLRESSSGFMYPVSRMRRVSG